MPLTHPQRPSSGLAASRSGATGLIVAAMAPAALASVAWPLLTYTLSLAAFGLAHVLWELHYVRARFGPRLEVSLKRLLGALLLAVVALRVSRIGDVTSTSTSGALELLVVVALCAAVLPALWSLRRRNAVLGAALVLLLGAGLAISPVGTLLLLAVLHNLTPVGLLVEAAPPGHRRRTLAGAAAVFVGVPLLIATGLPYATLHAAAPALLAAEASVLPAGPLQAHLSAYLPRAWHSSGWALHAFSALVFAQCAHYAAVIHVLPRHLDERERLTSRQRYAIAAACAILFIAFALDFGQTRSWYGVAAAVHAWIELPILIFFLGTLAPIAAASSAAAAR